MDAKMKNIFAATLLISLILVPQSFALKNAKPANIEDFPSTFAIIKYGKGGQDNGLCNAVKISNEQLLTAAHCFGLWTLSRSLGESSELPLDGVYNGENPNFKQTIDAYQHQIGTPTPERLHLKILNIVYLGHEDIAIINIDKNKKFARFPSAPINTDAMTINQSLLIGTYNEMGHNPNGSEAAPFLKSTSATVTGIIDGVPELPFILIAVSDNGPYPVSLEPGDSGSPVYSLSSTGRKEVVGIVHGVIALSRFFDQKTIDWLKAQVKIN